MILEPRRGGIILCHPFGVLSVYSPFVYNRGIPSGFSIALTTTSPNPYKISPAGEGLSTIIINMLIISIQKL
jgi:hypothetical protein